MKQEARLRFDNNDVLENIIKKSYFDNDNLGKIDGKDNEIYNIITKINSG